ncbi:MAG: hypothetical protein ABJ004_13935 [Cyclobacteriaceae bacterium]
MKNTVSIFMMIALVIQLQWRSGYLIDYYINTDTYKELCTNKDLPELHCDGKCILAQKLQEQRQNSESKPTYLIPSISFEFTLFCFFFSFKPKDDHTDNGNTIYYDRYAYSAQVKVFKPPA